MLLRFLCGIYFHFPNASLDDAWRRQEVVAGGASCLEEETLEAAWGSPNSNLQIGIVSGQNHCLNSEGMGKKHK